MFEEYWYLKKTEEELAAFLQLGSIKAAFLGWGRNRRLGEKMSGFVCLNSKPNPIPLANMSWSE